MPDFLKNKDIPPYLSILEFALSTRICYNNIRDAVLAYGELVQDETLQVYMYNTDMKYFCLEIQKFD